MIKISSNLERMLATKVAEGLGFNGNLARNVGVGALGGAGLGALIQAIRGKSLLKGLGLGALGGGLGGAGYNYLSGPFPDPFKGLIKPENPSPSDNPSLVDFRPFESRSMPPFATFSPEVPPIMPEASYGTGPSLIDARPFPAVREHGRSVGMQNAIDASDRIDRENAITFDNIRAITEAAPLPPFNLYRP